MGHSTSRPQAPTITDDPLNEDIERQQQRDLQTALRQQEQPQAAIPTVNQHQYSLMFGGPTISSSHFSDGPTIFYVPRRADQPPPPPPELRPTVTIKNDLNLLKRTLKLVRINNSTSISDKSDKTYTLEFDMDTRVPCDVYVHFAATERKDKKSNCIIFLSDKTHAFLHNSQNPPKRFATPVLKQHYVLDNVIDFAKCKHDDLVHTPDKFPIVIEMRSLPNTTTVQQQASDLKYQFTYCQVIHSTDGSYVCKVLKQKIQVNGQIYELADIYGIDNNASSTASPTPTTSMDQQQPSTTPLQPAEEKIAPAATIDDDDLNSCVICMSEQSDTAVLPCRHMCLCFDCAKMLRLQTNKCPICRAIVSMIVQIPRKEGETKTSASSTAASTLPTSHAKLEMEDSSLMMTTTTTTTSSSNNLSPTVVTSHV